MKFINYINESSKNFKIEKILKVGSKFIIIYTAIMYGNVETHDRVQVNNLTELLEKLDNWDYNPKDVPFGDGTLADFIDNMKARDSNIRDLVYKNCQPILKELRGHGQLLYRGSSINTTDAIKEITPRKDRRTLSSNEVLSSAVDTALYKKFGWHPRKEGVFVYYGHDAHAYSYGYVYCFLPIGDYKYVWSSSYEDLYLYLAPRDFNLTPTYLSHNWIPSITRGNVQSVLKILGLTSSKESPPFKAARENEYTLSQLPMDNVIEAGAKYAAKSYKSSGMINSEGCELSFKCDKYYLIQGIYRETLLDLIS